MQNILKTSAILLFLSIIFWNCGQSPSIEEENPSTTFAQFAIRYLEDGQQLRGQASFSQGDSAAVATPLVIEGGVAFMGSGMKQKDLPRNIIRYDATLTADFMPPFRFGFKLEGDEAPREIAYDMTAVGEFSVLSASKEDGLRIDLQSAVSSDEALLLLFTDPKQEARTILRPGPIKAGTLFIPADALLHFIPGNYGFYIVKTKEEKSIKNGVNSQIMIEFYSKEIRFDLN